MAEEFEIVEETIYYDAGIRVYVQPKVAVVADGTVCVLVSVSLVENGDMEAEEHKLAVYLQEAMEKYPG